MPKAHRRKRRTESEWIEILRRFESSDLTIRDFCHREGLPLSSFQRWRSRLGPVGPGEFVELVPAAAAVSPLPEWSLEVALPNGVQLRFRG
jgi:hypothetical protein